MQRGAGARSLLLENSGRDQAGDPTGRPDWYWCAGYTTLPLERRASRFARIFGRLGLPAPFLDPLRASTLTLKVHDFPGDYYRFSPQAVEEVFLEGLVEKELSTMMLPPRVIGFGIKPAR